MARVGGAYDAGMPSSGAAGCGRQPRTYLLPPQEGDAEDGAGLARAQVGFSLLTSLLSRPRRPSASAPASASAPTPALGERTCPECGEAAVDGEGATLVRRVSPRMVLGLAQGLAPDPRALQDILNAFDRRPSGGAGFTDLRQWNGAAAAAAARPLAPPPEDVGGSEGDSEEEGEGEGATDGLGSGTRTTGLGERKGGPEQGEETDGRRKTLEDGSRPSRKGSLERGTSLAENALGRFPEVLREALPYPLAKDYPVCCQAYLQDGASPRLDDIRTCAHCGVAELDIHTEIADTVHSFSPTPNDRELIRAERLSAWRPSNAKGCRRALLIAIDYWDCKKDRLGGCVEDCKTMLRLLVKDFHFLETQVVVLNDYRDHWGKDEFPNVHRYEAPTRENIMYWLHWLTRGAREGDSLFLYFAGHGTQEDDRRFVEFDSRGEVLWPVDHRKRRVSVIADNELYDEVVEKVPRGARLFAIFDCCHRGTNMDLPYLSCGSEPNEWTVTGSEYRKLQELKRSETYKRAPKPFEPPPQDESRGEVISLSATNESGKSIQRLLQATSPLVSPRPLEKREPEVRHKGVMTECFKRTIARNRASLDTLTFDRLIEELAEELRRVAFTGDIPSLDELQAPQLASNHLFDRKSLFII